MDVSRRDALTMGALGALGAAGLALPLGRGVEAKAISRLAARNMPKLFATAFRRPPLAPWTMRQDENGPFRLFQVTARAGTAQIVPGLSTPVYGYDGGVPGPTIRVPQGTRAKVRVRNQLPSVHPAFGHTFSTSTHLHGSASLPQYDGYANDITQPGEYKDYWYPNWQPARTLWYHDHNVHVTAQNAYSGLFAQYHLQDPAEQDLLPQGEYDVPLIITDAMFAADGSLAYDDNSHAGLYGDVVLVNGTPWPVMQVKPRIYRFRTLNASIGRSYRLRLSNGAPLVMVGTDGGLMSRSRPVGQYRHGQAERYEFLIDFSRYAPGTQIDLQNLSNPNNVDYDNTNKVMRFVVGAEGSMPPDQPGSRSITAVPDTLVDSEVMTLTEAQAKATTRLRLERKNGFYAINGKTWHDVEASGFRSVVANPEPDEVQLWEIENRSGGWFHPLHIHLIDFQVVSRNGKPPMDHELGPKDVVYVGENEKVQLLMKFTLQKGGGNSANAGGRYMVHCHNLPHEDHDMMQQFAVGDWAVNDPIDSALPQDDDGDYDDGDAA